MNKQNFQNRLAAYRLESRKPSIRMTRFCATCKELMPMLGGKIKKVKGFQPVFTCWVCCKEAGGFDEKGDGHFFAGSGNTQNRKNHRIQLDAERDEGT